MLLRFGSAGAACGRAAHMADPRCPCKRCMWRASKYRSPARLPYASGSCAIRIIGDDTGSILTTVGAPLTRHKSTGLPA
ncbi:hypothetical protein KCP71_14720 [Salmonella enterica subsp. enterica]|nr:hypothetical protein KCP71_14720 [Salmonella enterica subsp. enterica]